MELLKINFKNFPFTVLHNCPICSSVPTIIFFTEKNNIFAEIKCFNCNVSSIKSSKHTVEIASFNNLKLKIEKECKTEWNMYCTTKCN